MEKASVIKRFTRYTQDPTTNKIIVATPKT